MRKNEQSEGKKPYPINLERVYFTRSIVVAIPEHKPEGKISLLPENKIDVIKIENEENRYMAIMRTKMNPEVNPIDPYMVDMECVGLFNADKSLSYDDAIKMIHITGHNVLYGAIREAVASITGRQAFGQIILGLSVLTPTVPPNEEIKQ